MKKTLIIVLVAIAGMAWAMPEKTCTVESVPEICFAQAGPIVLLPAGWRIAAAADFNGDGYPDLLLHNEETGFTYIWYFSKPSTPR